MNTLKHWIVKRAEDDRGNMRLFSIGAVLFFFGLGLVVFANQRLLPSLGQELIVLLGLLIGGLGALTALAGYVALMISRFL